MCNIGMDYKYEKPRRAALSDAPSQPGNTILWRQSRMLAAATTRTWTLTVGLCSAACGEAVCRGDLDGNDGKDDDESGRQEARQ